MLPRDALYWVLLQQTAKQVIEDDRKPLDLRQRGVLDLRNKIAESLGSERRTPSRHLKQNTAKGPAVRLEAVHAFVRK